MKMDKNERTTLWFRKSRVGQSIEYAVLKNIDILKAWSTVKN